MALVDYSDSDSDSETATKPTPPSASTTVPPQTTTTAKQPVQKVVDRSNPRKIVVSLPGASKSDESNPTDNNGDEPPVKRAKTGGGAFSGFASFLPPPKNAGKAAAAVASSAAKTAPRRPGVNLKTGAAPGFSRSTDLNDDVGDDGDRSTSQQQAQPTIPAGQKPADEVKLVGKPMMFKPLSVSRRPVKKKNSTTAKSTTTTAAAKAGLASETPSQAESQPAPESAEPPKKKKKVSLFSIAQDEPADAAPSTGAYEPMFTTPEEQAETDSAAAFAAYDAQNGGASAYPPAAAAATTSSSASLDSLAAGMNLSKAARRELFGRGGAPDVSSAASSSRIIDFNTDKEYAHNEELRASGEQQTFNPVRAIAPGKHSLRQLVTQVHNQREALEESFAKGKSNQREAGSRYGWR
ncbi:mitotic checkpoint regulator- MAD2B-interacting-domain-containing protein [Apiospora marii]|uniref:Mitotic checkpoint regulator-MAD2B-interacting-domain-containing protein n=1 Tax=Apiospora marii TaxID=335849 RepID=A0ABR1S6V0_9PEZI